MDRSHGPAGIGALPPGVTLAPLAPDQPWFAEAVALYCATWPQDGPPPAVSTHIRAHAASPDYRGLVALRDGPAPRLVGFGFGDRSVPGEWWPSQVAAVVGADHPALHDAWELVDLAVAPEARGQGIGAALVTALLTSQPCPRALLSTEVDNATARRLYERLGWTTLVPGMVFRGASDTPFTIMTRELTGG